MGILNVTPDSFSDGGRFESLDAALRRAEEMVWQGAGVIDVGGESTRPGGARVEGNVEIDRVLAVIEAIAARFDMPISVDTSKSAVAEAALEAGAEIINDISGLRFDPRLAEVAARSGAGLVLMHSRGDFESMHSLAPAEEIFVEVEADFRRSIEGSRSAGVQDDHIVLDVGIGFGKTAGQNLELIAKLDKLCRAFPNFPQLVGASRKSFIAKTLDRDSIADRLPGSLAAAVVAVWNGASIIRAHDVRETVDAVRMARALKDHAGEAE